MPEIEEPTAVASGETLIDKLLACNNSSISRTAIETILQDIYTLGFEIVPIRDREVYRSAESGEFVTKEAAMADPKGTVKDKI